jgi:hypothetical protein
MEFLRLSAGDGRTVVVRTEDISMVQQFNDIEGTVISTWCSENYIIVAETPDEIYEKLVAE